jgi:MFS family permease
VTRKPPIIPFVNMAHAFDHFFMLIFPTAVLALESDWGSTYGETLAVGTVAYIMLAVGTLPSGWLGDRMNKAKLLTVFFIGIGLASVLTGFADGPFQLAVGLGLIGLFASIYHPVGTAMVVQTAKNIGSSLGINGVFGNLGVAFAGGITAVLVDNYGWRYAFYVPGAVAMVTGVVFWLAAGRTYSFTPEEAPEAPADSGPSAAKEIKPRPVLRRATLFRILAVIVVASLCGGVIFNALTAVMPKVFEERMADFTSSLTDIGGLVTIVFS